MSSWEGILHLVGTQELRMRMRLEAAARLFTETAQTRVELLARDPGTESSAQIRD